MIVLVRKFSVTYQNVPYKVLYVFEDKNGKLHYCACSQMGDQVFIEAEKVSSVDIDE